MPQLRIRQVQGGYRVDELVSTASGLYITWDMLYSTIDGAEREINTVFRGADFHVEYC